MTWPAQGRAGNNRSAAAISFAGCSIAIEWEQRPIKVGPTRDGIAVIDQGLAVGEQVVIDGQYKLRAGTRVEPRPVGATKAAAQAAS